MDNLTDRHGQPNRQKDRQTWIIKKTDMDNLTDRKIDIHG